MFCYQQQLLQAAAAAAAWLLRLLRLLRLLLLLVCSSRTFLSLSVLSWRSPDQGRAEIHGLLMSIPPFIGYGEICGEYQEGHLAD